jgi:hypothetical protein
MAGVGAAVEGSAVVGSAVVGDGVEGLVVSRAALGAAVTGVGAAVAVNHACTHAHDKCSAQSQQQCQRITRSALQSKTQCAVLLVCCTLIISET